MLRKILALTVAVCTGTLLLSADALAWGGGSWNRSGSASYTGRGGNSYSRSYSSSGSYSGDRYGGGYHYGGGGYHYGGGAYGAIIMVAVQVIMLGDSIREVLSLDMRPGPIIPSNISSRGDRNEPVISRVSL